MTHEPDTRHRPQLTEWLSIHVQLHRASHTTAGWAYCCTEELVLALGRWGVPSPLPPGHLHGPERRCYSNASHYSATHNLTYVEGYGLTNVGYACAHAWCVDEHGHVHDPTWPDGLALAYLGIPFSPTYIQAHDEEFDNACLLHDAHLDSYRILREGLPTDAILPIGESTTSPNYREA